ncbi:outer membrane beta-barrel protein [Ferruginibacter sp. SUN002]|uniref:outer membrane beta-barrel protein n=1 Tax=Ferruginibacter sp. SUN002 TaxID=2937789 RepID=UPI003D36FDC5
MSEERNFDNYIKNELSGFSTTVSPHVWDNIVAARKNRKPAGFWYNFFNTKNVAVLVGGVIVASLAAWLLSGGNNSNDPQKVNTVAAVKGHQSDDSKVQSRDQHISNQQQATDSKIVNTENSNSINAQSAKFSSGNNRIGLNKDQVYFPLADYNDLVVNDDALDLQKKIATRNILSNKLLLIEFPERATTFLQNRKFPNVTVPCPTVEDGAAGDKTYIEVYAGPDFTIRNFTDTTQSEYLAKRKASTKVSSAYSAGIRIGKVFKNGVSVKAGLNYSQINEKFTFVQNNLVQVTYIIDPNTGDTTGSYTVTGTRKKTTYNKYKTIDIPLMAGYEIGNGRLHVNISAGAMINVYSWQRGEVLDTNYLPVSITTGKSTTSPYQFRTNVGVGLTGGIGVYYKLTDQMHVLAEPYFRYNLNPMSKETLTLEQKYNTIGLRLGIRVDLK